MRGWIDRVLARCRPAIERFVAIGVVQASVVLAAQTFMALIPLLIGLTVIAPSGTSQGITEYARTRFGISGETNEQVTKLVDTGDHMDSGFTVLGLLIVLVSATSFTRALVRVYEGAWQLPKAGLRGSVRGLVWLLGLVVYLLVISLAIRLTASPAFAISTLRRILLAAGSLVLWWITPFLLLCGRVKLRALVVTAVLTAASLVVAVAASAKFMPDKIRSSEARFGTIGAAFTIESWLVGMAVVIVVAAMLGALAAQSGGWLGALSRGTHEADGWRREPRRLRLRKPRGP